MGKLKQHCYRNQYSDETIEPSKALTWYIHFWVICQDARITSIWSNSFKMATSENPPKIWLFTDKWLNEYFTFLLICPPKTTHQNSYSFSHLLRTVTTRWLDSDSVVITANCWQHGDWIANGSLVTMLPTVNNGNNTVTVKSPCSHSAA